RLIGLQPGCKTLSSLFLMLPQYTGQPLGFADCRRWSAPGRPRCVSPEISRQPPACCALSAPYRPAAGV
ncbi:hypothetical protein CKJ89_03445, partial [Klebsiella pneumoniae]